MSKKVKLEVILTIDKEINIDESMIQRSVGLLGDVDSFFRWGYDIGNL